MAADAPDGADDATPGPLPVNPLDVSYPRALLVGLLVVTALALVVAASTSGAAFGTYNPAWDGASDLRSEADAVDTDSEVVLNTTRYGAVEAEGTVAVVLSPDRPYTDAEAARVRRFVEGGGTLVVAEDFGSNANALLAAVGADARFDGALVRDERHSYQSPAMPLADSVSDHPLTEGVDRLTLNHGTVVEPGNASAIVNTTGFAYLDRNRNDELDENESLGTYPVATVEAVGEGRVVAVSDPSLFINAMLDREGNRRFVRNTFAASERVLLDYSHAERLPPLSLALTVVRASPPLQALVVGLGVVLVGAWGRGRFDGLVRRLPGTAGADPNATGPRGDELAAYLRRRHPDWDADRVRRVTEGVVGRRSDAEDE